MLVLLLFFLVVLLLLLSAHTHRVFPYSRYLSAALYIDSTDIVQTVHSTRIACYLVVLRCSFRFTETWQEPGTPIAPATSVGPVSSPSEHWPTRPTLSQSPGRLANRRPRAPPARGPQWLSCVASYPPSNLTFDTACFCANLPLRSFVSAIVPRAAVHSFQQPATPHLLFGASLFLCFSLTLSLSHSLTLSHPVSPTCSCCTYCP